MDLTALKTFKILFGVDFSERHFETLKNLNIVVPSGFLETALLRL